ncbi:hypothetical protein DFH28DRAFT_1128908 [Melampsora americana]|nr:hypothetical protein DFH28DRAFT_1128908 [Melampsora americana]
MERGDDFVAGLFAVICCTMALGLGQNWDIVQRVIVMGRADPSTICQMLGRCGRDGQAGLGVMLVESSRRGGKNQVKDFKNIKNMSDDDRMDALAITPERGLELGYVPLHFDDEEYIKEYDRQSKVAPCLCSNCEPDLLVGLMDSQMHVTHATFADVVTSTVPVPIRKDNVIVEPKRPSSLNSLVLTCPAKDRCRTSPAFIQLQEQLLRNFDSLYSSLFPRDNNFISREAMLSGQHAWELAKNSDIMINENSLRKVLGSEAVMGSSNVYWIPSSSGRARLSTKPIKTWKKEVKKANKETAIKQKELDLVLRQGSQTLQKHPPPSADFHIQHCSRPTLEHVDGVTCKLPHDYPLDSIRTSSKTPKPPLLKRPMTLERDENEPAPKRQLQETPQNHHDYWRDEAQGSRESYYPHYYDYDDRSPQLPETPYGHHEPHHPSHQNAHHPQNHHYAHRLNPHVYSNHNLNHQRPPIKQGMYYNQTHTPQVSQQQHAHAKGTMHDIYEPHHTDATTKSNLYQRRPLVHLHPHYTQMPPLNQHDPNCR